MVDKENIWSFLPYPILYKIFNYLELNDLISVSEVCHSWYEVSRDDFLWRDLFINTFKIDKSVQLIQGRSWYEEFKRLCYNVPVVETERLSHHGNQVLHVSFSHNGKYFATCSKDGFVYLWNSTFPVDIKYFRDMRRFSWKYTQYSQFNESDTLLLVSGVHFGTPHSTSGEIAVFNLEAGFHLQCRVVNKPYDIYGTWYNDQHLLSGDLHWLGHLVSTSSLWLNKASQEIDSEHVPITHNMYRFYNRNASSIRAIMIAKCLPNSELAIEQKDNKTQNDNNNSNNTNNDKKLKEQHGNPMSHNDISCNNSHQEHNNTTNTTTSMTTGSSSSSSSSANTSRPKKFQLPPSQIWYTSEYRQVESEKMSSYQESNNESENDEENEEIDEEDDKQENDEEISDEEYFSESGADEDKYLIFTTGYKTYTPHQIGFKRIKPFAFPKKLDPGPSLKERLIIHERRKELLRLGSPPPEPNWLDFDSVADKFDKIDHLIDLHGHIVGMALSPDHRYLYVNSRSWPDGYIISNPLDPPPIAQEIDIHVIDLVTLKEVGKMFRAHRAYTSNSDCFFIFLDVSDEYVASGAEDKFGYLWDRHYGICLMRYSHSDVVNSVAFNPKDPEMLVTTADDHYIKVWRSRAQVKRLGIDTTDLKRACEFRYTSKQKP